MAEPDAFATALRLHQSGQLSQAEHYYRAALPTHPSRAYVLVQLASVVQALGRIDEAIELQRQSLAERPDVAEAWVNLGTMLLTAGKFEESVAAQQRALSLRPDLAEAWVNLSATYRAWSKPVEALGAAQYACSLRPHLPQAHYQLGSSLRLLGRTREAITALEQAVRTGPQFFEAWYELGCSLVEGNDADRARQALSHAQSLRPESAEAACALGGVLCSLGEWQGARSLYERSLRIRPDLVESRMGLAAVLRGEGRVSQAVEAYSRCVQLVPANIEANRGLAMSLFDQERFDESLEIFERLARLYPNNPALQYELGCELLLRGDFSRGWPLFEKRLEVPRLAPVIPGPFPAWDGSDLTGRRILLHQEQGHGDTLQFVRYVLSPRFRNAKIVLRCQAPLYPLLPSQFPVEMVVPDGRPLPAGIDCHCTLPSLPFMFRTDAGNIPAVVPYVRPAPQLVDTWREKLGPRSTKLRVGITWAGNPAHPRNRRRSMPPEPLLEMAGTFAGEVEWFSLQKSQGSEFTSTAGRGLPLVDHTAAFTDFAQTAGLISQLDLVITVDTSIAHLAGAMGAPVWVMLPHMPDWRWQLYRTDSPWYRTMRLFRQPRPGAWTEVLAEVSQALRAKLAV